MSLIAVPYVDYECPRCHDRASSLLDRVLRHDDDLTEVIDAHTSGERSTLCECGTVPNRLNVNCYQGKCDGCGLVVNRYEDNFEVYAAVSPYEVWDFLVDWTHNAQGDFCEDCGPVTEVEE